MKIKKIVFSGCCYYSVADADEAMRSGASGVMVGGIAALRPWRVAGIVKKFLKSLRSSDERMS